MEKVRKVYRRSRRKTGMVRTFEENGDNHSERKETDMKAVALVERCMQKRY